MWVLFHKCILHGSRERVLDDLKQMLEGKEGMISELTNQTSRYPSLMLTAYSLRCNLIVSTHACTMYATLLATCIY